MRDAPHRNIRHQCIVGYDIRTVQQLLELKYLTSYLQSQEEVTQ